MGCYWCQEGYCRHGAVENESKRDGCKFYGGTCFPEDDVCYGKTTCEWFRKPERTDKYGLENTMDELLITENEKEINGE